MSEWSGSVAEFEDRIREGVQHSDCLGLRHLEAQHEPVQSDGSGDVAGTMPNTRPSGKRRNGSNRLASDNMGARSPLPTARSPDMPEDAATPARVASRQRRPTSQKQGASKRYVSRLTRNTLAVVMAGGRGERLKHLTDFRCKPATPFGGKFRIVDFVLSNCVNSGIRRISVLTQYKAHSLIQHIQRGWSYLRGEFGEFVEIIPAQQQLGDMWYRGTADALYQNLQIIKLHHPRHILVLAGDHIYKMDYGPMLAAHVEKKADITVGVVEVPREQATSFGVMTWMSICASPASPRSRAIPKAFPARENFALGSMGIYVFKANLLYRLLEEQAKRPDTAHDFGRNIIPDALRAPEGIRLSVQGHAYARAAVLARRRYGRCVLRSQHGAGARQSRAEHLRRAMADLDLSAPVSAGEVRARRWRPAWAWPSTRWCPAAASFPARTSISR